MRNQITLEGSMTTMEKSVSDLLFNPILRSNEITRYSGVRMQEEESLSQHIFEVTSMSYMLANKLISLGESIDISIILKKCLLHDFDEIVTGDVQRNVKYATPAIKMAMDSVASDGISTLQETYSDFLGEDFINVWSSAKKGKEGFILKLADMLVVARKAMIEVKIYHNFSAMKVVSELVDHLNNLSDAVSNYGDYNEKSKKYISKVTKEVSNSIDTLENSHKELINSFNLNSTIIKNSPMLDK